MDLRKLNGLHYKLLRISECDWKNRISRETLDKLGRMRPTIWTKYATANTVIKILRDRQPKRLYGHLHQTLYHERRQQLVMKFFDKSRYRVGRQCVGNRLKSVFDEIDTPFNLTESNDAIRVKLKKALGFIKWPDNKKLPPDKPSKKEEDDDVGTNRDATPTENLNSGDDDDMVTNRDATP
jgi:hypothetical protein